MSSVSPTAIAALPPSLLQSALPVSLQARLPKIPSLRRSVNIKEVVFRSSTALFSLASPSASSPVSLSVSSLASSLMSSSIPSSASSSASSPSSSRPSTSYKLDPMSTPIPDNDLTCDSDSQPPWCTGATSGWMAPYSRQPPEARKSADVPPSLPPPALPHRQRHSPHDSDTTVELGVGLVIASPGQPPASSLINWKYGQNGLRALETAAREAADPDRLPELERQIYVESLAYLLRGLPSDLQSSEVQQLRNAAPETLTGPPMAYATDSVLCPRAPTGITTSAGQVAKFDNSINPPSPPPSLPHLVTHWLVTRLYALAMVLVPLASSLVRLALEFDRKYHVPEALFRWGSALLLVLYRHALEMFVGVCRLGDGRVGRALDDGTAYLATGFSSGLRAAVLDVTRGQS